jgi:hypothetical protein
VSVEVLLDSGMSVYRVAVAVVTAVQELDIATRYLTETERTLPPLPTFKWQYNLAHIGQFVVFFSVWNVRKLTKHLENM